MIDFAQSTRLSFGRMAVPFAHWHAVWRSRRALARLEPHMLRDIGVTDFAARQEAARLLWDAPEPWKARR